MVMVSVVLYLLPTGGSGAQVSWIGPKVGGQLAHSPKWTRVNSRSGSLSPATRQHYEHCHAYYYYYY